MSTLRSRLLALALFPSTLVRAETFIEAAPPRIKIGCAIATRDLGDPKLEALITSEFNLITPEYDFMPELLVDGEGKFTFGKGDQIVDFAEKHKMPVLGHMLVWHHVTRKWLFESPDGKPLPREKGLENLRNYIETVMGHYKGRVKTWNVVNEAISDKEGEYLRDTPALRSIGEDYVQKAFEFAHAADPSAELYYNDYNIEQPGKLEKAVRLIKDLKAKGAKVDAIGVQGHWLLDWPPVDTITKGLDTLAATGPKLMVTELDIDPLPREVSGADLTSVESGANPYPDGLPAEVQEKLAKRYGEITAALAKHPAITVIGFWGTHDGRSWLNDFPVKKRTNHPLPFDRQYAPKPAHAAVVIALKKATR